ncbi:MAG TPA: hypothetical protein VHG27_05755 [Xanthobacteraceae bacterium]|nr:hypothetical protein [Xanthobacteraceae bacterium]
MAPQLSRHEERRGTRRVMLWGVAIAALLLLAVTLWPLIPGPETGSNPNTGLVKDPAQRTQPAN